MNASKFSVILFVLIFSTSAICSATTYYSRANGNWSSPSTWNILIPGIGVVPSTSSYPLGNDTANVYHDLSASTAFINYVTLYPGASVGSLNVLGTIYMYANSEIGLGGLATGSKFSNVSTIIFPVTSAGQNPPRIYGPLTVLSDSALIYVGLGHVELHGGLNIHPGAKLNGSAVCYGGDIMVNGILRGSVGIRRNSLFTNNGTIFGSIVVDSCNVELSGNGLFPSISGGSGYNANITFTSNIELGGLSLHKCGLHLNNHTLKLSGSFFYDSSSTLFGPGEVHTNGNAAISGVNQGFPLPLVVVGGRTTISSGSMTFSNSITVNQNAILDLGFTNSVLTINGILINNGLLRLSGGLSGKLNMYNTFYNNRSVLAQSFVEFNFYQADFYNYDSISYTPIATNFLFNFYGSSFNNNGVFNASSLNFFGNTLTENNNGLQTINGTGSISNSTLNIKAGADVALGSNHKINSININSGGSFDISNKILYLNGSNPIINNGSFNTAGSIIEYNGSAPQNFSVTNVNYESIHINNPSGVRLLSNMNFNDTLRLISGDFDLGSRTVTFSPSAYLIETPGNTVIGSSGFITTTHNLNAPSSFDVNGLGVVISSAANLGTTVINRYGTFLYNLNGGGISTFNQSIKRYFDITPTNNSGINATLTFKYDDSELNNRPEGSLQLFRSTNNGGSWTFRGGTINTTSNEITLSGIDAFSRWTAGSGYQTAPIKVTIEGLYNSSTNRMNRKDTVRVYLRSNSSPYSIVDSAKSVIDSTTFNGSFTFVNAPSGTYYVVAKHRNSIETWSKTGGEVYNLGSAFSYDFTTVSSQAYGNNMRQVDSSPLRFAIYSGDVNQDGIIDVLDIVITDNDAFNFVTGYVRSDVNGNNVVDASDLGLVENNAFNFVSKITPP